MMNQDQQLFYTHPSNDEKDIEIARLQEKVTSYDRWLSNGIYFTNLEWKEHQTANSKEIAKLREALEFECGGRCNAEYNPCNAREALADKE
jgi:hypothetical protein